MNRQMNGVAVREFRRALHIKASDLATRAIVSTSYLCNIEAGRKQPAQDVMDRIADALGVDVEAVTYSPKPSNRRSVAA